MANRIDPSQWIEWEYARPQGDISVFAPTKDDAIRTMREHGITSVDPAKVTKKDRVLADVLKREGIA